MWQRGLTIASALLWALALAAPAQQIIEASPPRVDATTGYWLLLFGWLGPLAASIAWYANVPFAWALVRLARGRAPGRLAGVAGVMAATVMLPSCQVENEADMTPHWTWTNGPAVWLWLGAFAALLLASRRKG